MRLLLDLGADPNTASKKGTTPLGRAAFNGHLSTMKLLIDAGAEPFLARRSMNYAGQDAHDLILTQDPALVEQRRKERRAELEQQLTSFSSQWTHEESKSFREARARARLLTLATQGACEELRAALDDIFRSNQEEPNQAARLDMSAGNVFDKQGRSLLAIAAWKGHVDVVEMLLMEWKERSWSPLGGPTEEEREAAKFFKIDVDARFGPWNRADGWTAFSVAAFCGNAKCAELLRLHGANPLMGTSLHKDAFQVASAGHRLLGDAQPAERDGIKTVVREFITNGPGGKYNSRGQYIANRPPARLLSKKQARCQRRGGLLPRVWSSPMSPPRCSSATGP